MDAPSDAATLERAKRLGNKAMFTIALQRRRLRSKEPEDEEFVFRFWADLEFLIIALRRLRRAALVAQKVPSASGSMKAAIDAFDAALPGLNEMRNVSEHVEQYAVDEPSRHHLHISRKQLEVAAWDGTVFSWLDRQLNIDTAFTTAENLFVAIRDALKAYQPPKNKVAALR